MPSTEKNKLLADKIYIHYNDFKVKVDIYDTPLGGRFLRALQDNLVKQRVLEKNFCFLGWTHTQRDLTFLCNELNNSIWQINRFNQSDGWKKAGLEKYQTLKTFEPQDFQHPGHLPTGQTKDGLEMTKPGLRIKHDACNLLHRYFEELQGTARQVSEYYKFADTDTKYAIRQLNNICHEIESWVMSNRKSVVDPEWIRPSQITTFLNAPRINLHDEDFDLFKKNRYDRELGGVYLHWSQVGKTLFEVYRDEDAPVMTETLCSEINHQKYYSGEFDIEWGGTITCETHSFKKKEIDSFKKWLAYNDYDWEDPKLSLGYIKLGQVDLSETFQENNFDCVNNKFKKNLNISKIELLGDNGASTDYPYTLEGRDWKQIQKEFLKTGYESRSMR